MTKPKGEKLKDDPNAIKLRLDANKPESKFKPLGGGQMDEWNERLNSLTVNALPIASRKTRKASPRLAWLSLTVRWILRRRIDRGNTDRAIDGGERGRAGDVSEGLVAAARIFRSTTEYLQLADKATRTVMMLTERLDHHRGRGQQQITVKHVTTNNVTADQAIIAENVATGADRAVSPALLATSSATPMPNSRRGKGARSGWGGGRPQVEMTINPMQSAHNAPQCGAKSKRTGEAALRRRFGASRLSDAWRRGGARPERRTGISGTVVAQKRRSRQ